MPLSELLQNIFLGQGTRDAAAIVQASFIKALESKDKLERDRAQRYIDWYNRDRIAIIEHVKEQARRSFDSTEDWQFPIVNGVPRTIKRLSQGYISPPAREYHVDGKALEGTALDPINRMFSGIDINRKMRSLDRWSTLLNTVHVEVVPRKGLIDWDIRLRPDVTVIPDPSDFLEFVKFAYAWTPMDPDSLEPTKGWVYWTDEEHVFISAGGLTIGMSNEKGTNPYTNAAGEPVIPITTVRKIEDIADYWGSFGADLVDAMQTMNVQLGNIWETTILQVHGQPFLVNVELEKGKKVKIGPKHPITVTKVSKDDVAPSLTFPKPDPDIEETQGFLDWFIKTNAAAYGLPPSAWAIDEQRLSGFAKFMDNIELLEMREEDATQWETTEQDLYTKSAIVWNTWAAANSEPLVPEEVEVKLDFPPVKVPESPAEKTQRWALQIASGQASHVDYFMEEEGLDKEAAEKRAIEVADQNKKITSAGAEPVARLPEEEPEGGEGETGAA